MILKNNLKTVVQSLKKSIFNAKIKGILISSEICILNSIYNLLTNCNSALTEKETEQLSLIYNYVYYKYPNICNTFETNNTLSKSSNIFVQNSTTSVNTSLNLKQIIYWQEINYLTNFEDVKVLITDENYVKLKNNDIYLVFEKGKTITYNNIGRLCFLLTETLSNEIYSIFDILNNDVTNSFDQYYDVLNKQRLFVSKNIYSHGDIFIKIKK